MAERSLFEEAARVLRRALASENGLERHVLIEEALRLHRRGMSEAGLAGPEGARGRPGREPDGSG